MSQAGENEASALDRAATSDAPTAIEILRELGLDPARYSLTRPRDFVLCLAPRPDQHDADSGAGDYLHAQILAHALRRERLWQLVDATGLVCVLGVHTQDASYRGVRGRSSKGRLSQGEYYHHDGCSGPTKPRVVEIRCPHQVVPRKINTAVAPFPDTVVAMLDEVRTHPALRSRFEDNVELRSWAESRAELGEDVDWDHGQGLLTRLVRRELDAESARAYFRGVDALCDAYAHPWQMGESRLIANANPQRTMQHRRAYARPHLGGEATGHLCKRWPCEELPPAVST